jgi:hypothetical protein
MVQTYYQVSEEDSNDYIIVSDSPEQVAVNFKMSELYNSKTGLSQHPMGVRAIDCLQAVRNYFGVPIRVNSTYRNYIPVDGVSPASISPHMLAQAVDFSFIADREKANNLYIEIREDFDNKGELFHILWDLGCRGFGSYDTFIHLDTTISELYEPFRNKRTSKYMDSLYARWNKMKLLRYKTSTNEDSPPTNVVEDAVNTVKGVIEGYTEELLNPEDRGRDVTMKNSSILISIVVVVIVLFLLPFFVFK